MNVIVPLNSFSVVLFVSSWLIMSDARVSSTSPLLALSIDLRDSFPLKPHSFIIPSLPSSAFSESVGLWERALIGIIRSGKAGTGRSDV